MNKGKTTARASPEPSAKALPKVAAATAEEVLARYEASKDALALVKPGMAPEPFLDRLQGVGLYEDALAFLAYALPRREALWWGLACVRKVTPADAPPEIAAALAATDAWTAAPSEERRRAALKAAEAATYGTPAGCLALAVFFNEGSLAPPDCPPIPVGEWFCARTVAAAVHLGSLALGPEQSEKTARDYVNLGIGVASQPAVWEKR